MLTYDLFSIGNFQVRFNVKISILEPGKYVYNLNFDIVYWTLTLKTAFVFWKTNTNTQNVMVQFKPPLNTNCYVKFG